MANIPSAQTGTTWYVRLYAKPTSGTTGDQLIPADIVLKLSPLQIQAMVNQLSSTDVTNNTNSVTGTGATVQAASPTLSGTVTINNGSLSLSKVGSAAIFTLDSASGTTFGAYIEMQSGEAAKWRMGYQVTGLADDKWYLYDATNSVSAIVVTSGASPSVAFTGAVSVGTTFLATGAATFSSTVRVNGATSLGTAAGTDQTVIDGTAFGVGVASLRLNGLSTAAVTSQVGTLTNAPVAGNPTFWAPVSIAGVVKYSPLW